VQDSDQEEEEEDSDDDEVDATVQSAPVRRRRRQPERVKPADLKVRVTHTSILHVLYVEILVLFADGDK
jgi:hypothetical protein